MHFSFLTSAIGITPTGAVGVSLGPYKAVKDQRYIHNHLASLRFLVLRDKVSFDEACSLDLPYTPVLAADLAMLLPKIIPDLIGNPSDSEILGITICHYESYIGRDTINERRRESTLLRALINLVDYGFSGVLRFFIFNGNIINGDRNITMEFCTKLKAAGARVELIDYSSDPIAIFSKVTECRAMISTRLHGAIFSAAANVPCCLIEYHRKCTDFIAEVGVAEKWRIGDADCTVEELAEKLRDLLTTSPAGFYPRREHLIEMAERNFTFNLH